mmetsp:Transcript_14643/g.16884  ORF Transcript_14643/g.16884 Transcript_14643/m.16884 type:complete len:117 (+) Transcript_14643:397-747(+)
MKDTKSGSIFSSSWAKAFIKELLFCIRPTVSTNTTSSPPFLRFSNRYGDSDRIPFEKAAPQFFCVHGQLLKGTRTEAPWRFWQTRKEDNPTSVMQIKSSTGLISSAKKILFFAKRS